MYQHLNEDGTPYTFTRGVDHYMPVSLNLTLTYTPIDHPQQRDHRLRGILREVMTRSVFEYYHEFLIGSPDSSEEELSEELVFEEAGLELGDTGSENDLYLGVCFCKIP